MTGDPYRNHYPTLLQRSGGDVADRLFTLLCRRHPELLSIYRNSVTVAAAIDAAITSGASDEDALKHVVLALHAHAERLTLELELRLRTTAVPTLTLGDR